MGFDDEFVEREADVNSSGSSSRYDYISDSEEKGTMKSYVDKLAFLEFKAGAKVHYRVMPPLTEPFRDQVAIQKVGKQIADFIGLSNYSFIISLAKQKENVGGHIDLSNSGKDVFVEIDSDMMKFPDAVAATLCHEVCHKWLHVNSIKSITVPDNEILTDITSVFLGFGKVMLNGCKTSIERVETSANGTRTITNTMTAGYLNRDQLAFVYRLVCAMRKTPSSEIIDGLNYDAILAVQQCNATHGHLYDQRFHSSETTQGTVSCLKDQLDKAHRSFNDLNKHIVYVKKSFCETIDNFLKLGHDRHECLREKSLAMAQDAQPDPALNFLRSIQYDFEIKRMTAEVHTSMKKTEELLQHSRNICNQLSRIDQHFPGPVPAMFNILTCPKDGTKLRLPENSGNIIATCPSCKFRFEYNTNTLTFSEPPSKWRKVLNLINRA